MDERQPAYIAGQAAPESHFSSEESHERMAETSVKTLKTWQFPESQDNLDSGRGSLCSYTKKGMTYLGEIPIRKKIKY